MKTSIGYESLKIKYMRQLSKNFPGVHGEPDLLNKTLADNMDLATSGDDDDDREVTIGILPINPIVEKDLEIAELMKTVEHLSQKWLISPILKRV